VSINQMDGAIYLSSQFQLTSRRDTLEQRGVAEGDQKDRKGREEDVEKGRRSIAYSVGTLLVA